ncbi:MAG TPA: MaoC/PaaZ C-terminal domain-containing protein [Gemmatimonadaceae bacterium]|nr:MaoC/PaaZ C-terminal domain-containing protein [Gemmatimonadaceae bacterium]
MSDGAELPEVLGPGRAPLVGDVLPPLALPPLTRATLALYAGGSGDHIPLHIDSDFARRAGHRDVFMHGMLGVAYLARMVTQWVPQERLRDLAVRFTAMTFPGEALTATGAVAEIASDGSTTLDLTLRNEAGEVKIAGRATIAPA